MASNIASGMRRIHEKGFIHRDIRPDNILVTSDYVAKIADMGIAKLFDASKTNNTKLGCNPYMPKEFDKGEYTQKLDIFTFGLSIYHLFSGKQHSFENGAIQLETPSPVFQHLINKCIDDDPEKRQTALGLEKLFRIHYRMLMEVIEKVPNYTKLDKQDEFDLFVPIHDLVRDKLDTLE
jgi:serine/threonine protein kinase